MQAIGITGHQSATSGTWELVRLELRELLTGQIPFRGLSSLAAGADQEFARVVLDLKQPLTVVIPSANYEATLSGEPLASYRSLLSRAAEIVQLSYDEPTESAFLAAGIYIATHASQVVAVWDGEPPRGSGGTADVVAQARAQGKPVVIIWPDGASRD